MTRLKLVAVLAAVAVLGGCAPARTWAVKLTPTGLPQFVDTLCEPVNISQVEIRVPDAAAVIWKIEFARPVWFKEITVGQKPEGAEEKVAWQPPKGDQPLEMSVRRDGGDASSVQFTLDELKDGKVRYDDEYLTADEFAKKRPTC